MTTTLDIVLLSGISGSGKSVALNALEDAGYFCVDNLPPELLRGMIDLEVTRPKALQRRVAVSVDVRSVDSLPDLMPVLSALADSCRGDGSPHCNILNQLAKPD